MDFEHVSKLTETEARAYLEKLRWPTGVRCAHCNSDKITAVKGKSARDGLYQCNSCREQFTVTVNTIFHRSHISLRQWVMAFHLICASKKGISALQLQRMLGLKSYKSAWHMAHRIRHAMRNEPLKTLLSGDVEVDETWVGPRKSKPDGKNDWQANKVAVMTLVERDGRMRTKVMPKVTKENLKNALDEIVESDANIMSDELQAYKKITGRFASHQTVNHSRGEYARGNVHVNSAESFHSLLKRGIHGTFHHVGKGHLHRYCDEFAFRWNHRKTTDAERTEAALRQAPGARLQYD